MIVDSCPLSSRLRWSAGRTTSQELKAFCSNWGARLTVRRPRSDLTCAGCFAEKKLSSKSDAQTETYNRRSCWELKETGLSHVTPLVAKGYQDATVEDIVDFLLSYGSCGSVASAASFF